MNNNFLILNCRHAFGNNSRCDLEVDSKDEKIYKPIPLVIIFLILVYFFFFEYHDFSNRRKRKRNCKN